MHKRLLGLALLPLLFVTGCRDWNPHEQDLINQIKITDATYYTTLTEEQLMDRFYGACHMLQGGMPMTDVLKQVPRNRNAGSWSNDIELAITFLCPEQRGKVNAR